jgi:hypothetical protein
VRGDLFSDRQALAAVIGMLVGTPLAILLVYGRWSDFGLPPVFLMDFSRWPWLRVSILMTLVTCLTGLAARTMRSQGTVLGSTVTYVAVVVPLVFLLLYPGPAALGRYSDPGVIYAILLFQVVHGLGFRAIRASAERTPPDNG